MQRSNDERLAAAGCSRNDGRWPFMRLCAWLAGLWSLLLILPGIASAQTNLVQDPSFESGALAPNWTVLSLNCCGSSPGVYIKTAGAAIDDGVAPALLPGNGINEAVLRTDGPSTNVLYQDVALPANSTITVQATVALVVAFPDVQPTDFYRVDIVQATPATLALGVTATNTPATFAAGVIQALYQHDRSASVASVDTPQFDISAYAGQTVRIRAVNNAQFNYTQGVLDNVRIIATSNALPPPRPYVPPIELKGMGPVSEAGTSVTVTVTLIIGAPTANVVLPIVSTNTSEVVVSAPSLTFTPDGPVSQTITFTGVDDQVIDGDQQALILVGPAVSDDPKYDKAKPWNFYIVNRDNDVALPALPFAGSSLTGYVDITNTGSTPISSIRASVFDPHGNLKGSGILVQNLPGRGNVSLDMPSVQSALKVTGVLSGDNARIELFPVGGEILAQGRIRNGGDTINASAASRIGSPGMQGSQSSSSDGFKLSITNLTAQAQDGRATIYNGDGSILGSENALLFSALAPKASIEFDALSLQKTLGVAPWANRAWLKMSDPNSFSLQLLNASSGVRALSVLKNVFPTQTLNYILPAGDAKVVSNIRIYNDQSYPTPFDGYLYKSDGTQLAVVSFGTLKPHEMLLVTSSRLQEMGVPAWTGPARLKIISDITRFWTQGSLRNQGVLTDTTNVITDGIVAHLPDSTEGLDIEVHIVNPGTQTTALTGTLTNGAGQTIGSADFALGNLAANASMSLSRSNLESLAGIIWSGRATLTLKSSANNVEVLALLRNTTSGALTNLSERPLR